MRIRKQDYFSLSLYIYIYICDSDKKHGHNLCYLITSITSIHTYMHAYKCGVLAVVHDSDRNILLWHTTINIDIGTGIKVSGSYARANIYDGLFYFLFFLGGRPMFYLW